MTGRGVQERRRRGVVGRAEEELVQCSSKVKRRGGNLKSSVASPSKGSGGKGNIEEDPAVLERREKQIRYGKNTEAYELYMTEVPKHQRRWDMPRTPDKHRKYRLVHMVVEMLSFTSN